MLEAKWSDQSRYVVYRTYSEFMELHVSTHNTLSGNTTFSLQDVFIFLPFAIALLDLEEVSKLFTQQMISSLLFEKTTSYFVNPKSKEYIWGVHKYLPFAIASLVIKEVSKSYTQQISQFHIIWESPSTFS